MHRMRDDRGAVALLVAIILPPVLLGMGALVLDFGALYAEKRQLQNGADAGALAVAREYASSTSPTCVSGARISTADSYADANANDTAGSNVAAPECPAVNKVRITTSTSSADGGFIAPILAQVLGNGPTTLEATAAAAWGAPSSLTSDLPLTISLCEFNHYAGGGSSLKPPPPYPPYHQDVAIPFHTTGGTASGCPSSTSGADLPGGFGWLDPNGPSGTCVASTDTNGWVDDSTGVSVPGSTCRAKLTSLLGKVINLPVYDLTNGLTGSNGQFRIATYGAFVLTGYRFPGEVRASLYSGDDYCGPHGTPPLKNSTCVYGFFTNNPTVGSGTVGSGAFTGVTVTQLTD